MGVECLSSDPRVKQFNVARARDFSYIYSPTRALSSSKVSSVNVVKEVSSKEIFVMRNLLCYEKTKNPKAETRQQRAHGACAPSRALAPTPHRYKLRALASSQRR